MSLDRLVDEIRQRGEAELRAIDASLSEKTAAIAADRDRRIAGIRRETERVVAAEGARERAQRIAAAKLQARKRLYEAREARLQQGVAATRALLAWFTRSPEYAAALKRMYAAALEDLGPPIRVTGRAEDAAVLQRVCGRSFDPAPAPIVGGLIAETADGRRRLNLSFDELLRLREDRVRELLA